MWHETHSRCRTDAVLYMYLVQTKTRREVCMCVYICIDSRPRETWMARLSRYSNLSLSFPTLSSFRSHLRGIVAFCARLYCFNADATLTRMPPAFGRTCLTRANFRASCDFFYKDARVKFFSSISIFNLSTLIL